VRTLAVGLVFSIFASAEAPPVCLEDRVGLNAFTRSALEAEIIELAGVKLFRQGACAFPAVSVIISAHPPAEQAKVLGLAYRNGHRVLPKIRVFTEPVLRILGSNASAAQFGRALARVTAHELDHYFSQQLHHDEEGLMKAAYNGLHLAAEDSSRFRPPSKD
jgi:hypothetical protein